MPARRQGRRRRPRERHLTEIDWVLTRGAARRDRRPALDRLGRARRPRARRAARSTSRATRACSSPIGEPTLSVTFEVTIDGLRLDDVAADPVVGDRAGRRAHPRHRDRAPRRRPARGRRAAARAGGAQVLLRAEVGSVQMPIERMLELAPGALSRSRSAPRTACGCSPRASRWAAASRAAAAPAARSSSSRRANRPSRADTYAKLGRSELERAAPHPRAARRRAEGQRDPAQHLRARVGRAGPHAPAARARPGADAGRRRRARPGRRGPVELFANGLCFANGSARGQRPRASGACRSARSSRRRPRPAAPQDLGGAGR